MKKLIFILLFCLTTSAFGQFFSPYQKPNLGFQVNGVHPLAPTAGWLFNEDSGWQVFDLSGNNNTGILNNDVTWGAGKYGSSLYFPCVNGFVSIPQSVISGSEFTLVFDIKPSEGAPDGYMLSDNADFGNLLFRHVSDTTFGLYVGEQSTTPVVADTTIQSHFAITHNSAGDAILYFNGIQLTTLAGSNFVGLSSDLYLGNRAGLDRDYIGQFEYLTIYNCVLSASEIALLYREPFCFMEPSWNWVLYGGLAAPSVGGQFIFINQ